MAYDSYCAEHSRRRMSEIVSQMSENTLID